MQKRSPTVHLVAGALLMLGVNSSDATNRYRAVDLNRGEPFGTVVLAVDGRRASGFEIDSYRIGREIRFCRRGVHWPKLNASPVRLYAAGSLCSDARGMSGAKLVGSAGRDYSRAVIWESATGRKLSASGLAYDSANGVHGGEIVGQASGVATGGHLHAVLWNIGTGSLVDLNGTDHLESAAIATDGKRQVGWASDAYGENVHAMLWSGTATAVLDMNPESFDSSYAYAIDAGSQVGVGILKKSAHALLWYGSPDRFVDLNPPGFVESYATGVSGKEQVGYAIKSNLSAHALVWSGKPSDFVDLQEFLPSSLTQSYATCIDAAGEIGGFATSADGTPHAIVWRPVRSDARSSGRLASVRTFVQGR